MGDVGGNCWDQGGQRRSCPPAPIAPLGRPGPVPRLPHRNCCRDIHRCRRCDARGSERGRRCERGTELAGEVPVFPPGRGGASPWTGGGGMSPGVLVAGIGNIFLSDDGFGVEVANRLASEAMPSGVRVADFGIRGVHLAYELLDGYDRLILVDAVPMGEAPGTLAVIQPTAAGVPGPDGGTSVVDAHSMSPDVVLATLSRLGGSVEEVYIVGCQPASLDEGIGLSPSVASAVGAAVELCRQLADGPVQAGILDETHQ